MKTLKASTDSSFRFANLALALVFAAAFSTGCGGSGSGFSTPASQPLAQGADANPKAESASVSQTGRAAQAWQLLRGMRIGEASEAGPDEDPAPMDGGNPAATELLRRFKIGDKFTWDVDATADGQEITGLDNVQVTKATYRNIPVLCFSETTTANGDLFRSLFTQNASTRDISYVAAYDNSRPILTPSKMPGALSIGTSFYLYSQPSGTGKIGFKMTYKKKELVRTPAGTFMAYKATSTIVAATDPVYTPVSMTMWVCPGQAPFVKETITMQSQGIDLTVTESLKSLHLQP